MSLTAAIVVGVVIAALATFVLIFHAHAQSKPPQGKADPALYQDLRSQAFAGSRTSFGLPATATATATEPWGVLMDSSFKDGGSYTVVAIVDGSASIYLSTGGGFIGGVAHETVRKAAKAMVGIAETFQPQMALTTSYPLPKGGETTFYLLTDAGVFTATASEQALANKQHAFSPLFYAAQAVITQYRLINERKKGDT
jgi:hypothetical protein